MSSLKVCSDAGEGTERNVGGAGITTTRFGWLKRCCRPGRLFLTWAPTWSGSEPAVLQAREDRLAVKAVSALVPVVIEIELGW
jgi:hypothetical protein